MNVVSLSGGLDSTILTYMLVDQNKAKNVTAISFNYNQKHSIELEKAKITTSKLGITHKIIDISFLGDLLKDSSALIANSSIKTPTLKDSLGNPQPKSYVPNRNLLLASICASYAESINAELIYFAFQQQDNYGYWDVSTEFVNRLNEVLNLNRLNKIEIRAPFIGMHKHEEIEMGISLNVPFEDTISCYNPNEMGESCGICLTCADRIGNFMKAKVKDPIKYSIDINWSF